LGAGNAKTPRAAVAAPGFKAQSQNAPLPPSVRRQRGRAQVALCAKAIEAMQVQRRTRRRHSDRTSPQWAAIVGLRPGLLRQVARKRAVLDAGDSLPVRHEGRFTDTPPGLDVELPRHASSMWPQVVAGALVPCCWGIDLAASGNKPVKLSCEDAESAMSPFGSGRPVRPCLVVNPGGGAAAPWAL